MQKIFLVLITLISGIQCFSQINALTSTGDEVVLYENGTWQYVNDSLNSSTIEVNGIPYYKDNKSTFLIKSSKTNVGLWINPKKWRFSKAPASSAAEYTFEIKNDDIQAMLITEKIEIPIENLIQIAYENALDAAPDAKIIKQEYRIVNGLDVIMMQITGTISGIKFIYYSYYYSNSSGSYQLVSYTSQNLFEASKKDMEEFLNGFVEQ